MTPTSDVPTRAELHKQLTASRIAGPVATPRQDNLDHYQRMSRREPLYLLGLRPERAWTAAEVLALMAERCGVSPDPSHASGQDTIDPDRTIERLEAMAVRLRSAALRRERVLVATGHPVGLRPVHTAIARALGTAGCTLLAPAAGWAHPSGSEYDTAPGSISYVDGVAVVTKPTGALLHTHSPLPMVAALADLVAAGESPPDLVVADHGWTGAAGQAGVDAVGFADSNDPALFVGEAEGRVLVCVPLDDNVDPRLYAPLTRYLLARAGLSA